MHTSNQHCSVTLALPPSLPPPKKTTQPTAHINNMTQRVFVYGTLKRGFHNHDLVMRRPGSDGQYTYIGPAQTALPYPLFIDIYGVPYLADVRAGGSIAGELYDVTEEGLAALDELEGVPTRYQRVLVGVEVGAEGEKGAQKTKDQAWLYIILADIPNLASRDLLDGYSLALHQKHFVPQGPGRDAARKQPWGGYE